MAALIDRRMDEQGESPISDPVVEHSGSSGGAGGPRAYVASLHVLGSARLSPTSRWPLPNTGGGDPRVLGRRRGSCPRWSPTAAGGLNGRRSPPRAGRARRAPGVLVARAWAMRTRSPSTTSRRRRLRRCVPGWRWAMARSWKKHGRWPHVAKNGARSYFVGFYDHDGSQRTRSFPAARAARDWMEDYVSAERRGRESLRRFLLDLDAREANAASETRTIGEVVQLYFAFNAPDTADGLATSTFRTYSWSAKRHLLGHEGASRGRRMPPAKYAARFVSEPAERFNHAAAPRALRDAMRCERVGQSARAHAWRVLSVVLSWARSRSWCPRFKPTAACWPTRRSATGGSLCEDNRVVEASDVVGRKSEAGRSLRWPSSSSVPRCSHALWGLAGR